MTEPDLNARARDILRRNDQGGYTIPTDGLYPYQWNWDSVFVALGFATFDRDRAWTELESLFEGQWPDGMVPHILFRADAPSYFPGPSVWGAAKGPIPSSGISQPPVAASVVLELVRDEPERARPFLAPLDAWHRWWHAYRDPEGLGIMAVTHPWESGRDNLPDWDAPGEAIDVSGVGDYTRADTSHVDPSMRPTKKDYDRYLALVYYGRDCGWDHAHIAATNPFFVADPAVTAILLRAERDLARLAGMLGEDTGAIEARIARMEAGFERLWNADAGGYCSLDLRSGRRADTTTAASFLAFWAGIGAHREAQHALLDAYGARVAYLVPSYDPRSPLFDHVRYWRGPVWAMINYMIARGLSEAGESDRAARIRRDTARLIRRGGFAEYFSPLDGQGCGGGSFSWTAAIWLAWELSEAEREDA